MLFNFNLTFRYEGDKTVFSVVKEHGERAQELCKILKEGMFFKYVTPEGIFLQGIICYIDFSYKTHKQSSGMMPDVDVEVVISRPNMKLHHNEIEDSYHPKIEDVY